MNKKQILASLNNIANELDNTGLHVEANSVTKVMTRLADEDESKKDESKLERAIERFERFCERLSEKEIPYAKKLNERRNMAFDLMDRLEGEDKEKFEKATHNIGV